MQVDTPRANPFMLMMTPQKVLEAMKKSDALRRLQHQVFHPLDSHPASQGDAELAVFDAAIESAALGLPDEENAPPA